MLRVAAKFLNSAKMAVRLLPRSVDFGRKMSAGKSIWRWKFPYNRNMRKRRNDTILAALPLHTISCL